MREQLPEFMQGWPFLGVYLFMLFGGTTRGQGLYWLARIVTEQALAHTRPKHRITQRMHYWLEDGGASNGIESVRKWGLPVVTLCYFTVGFQTMVLTGSGVLRIPWWKYTLATIPGAMGWALIYSTIGFAALGAVISAAAGSPLGIAATIGFIALVAALVTLLRRRKRARAAAEAAAEAAAGTAGEDA